jgi:integrase
MIYNLREKHGDWYCVVEWRDEQYHRKERWIPLRIRVSDERKRDAALLVKKIEASKGFNPDSVDETNRMLAKFGLFQYDCGWHILKNVNTLRDEKTGKPILYNGEDSLSPEVLNDALERLKRGKKMLFGDFLVVWFSIHREELAEGTIQTLGHHVFKSIGPWFNAHKITLTDLEPEDIESFYREKGQTVTSNTLRHYHATIRSALQFAFQRGYVVNNVADRVTKPKKTIYKGSFYNEEQLKTLFTAAKDTNLEFAVHMASYYGLRREEVCGLRWDAIDFQYKTMTIKHTVCEAKVNGVYQLFLRDTTKNKSSFRTLPLSDSTMELLLARKEKQERLKTAFGTRYNHDFDDYIYVFENGDIIRPGWLTSSFRKLLKDNNLPLIRFHDLRHSCATLLRHEGVAMEDISKWLGHSNLLTTEQVYAHYDDSLKEGTLKAVSRALDKKKEMG